MRCWSWISLFSSIKAWMSNLVLSKVNISSSLYIVRLIRTNTSTILISPSSSEQDCLNLDHYFISYDFLLPCEFVVDLKLVVLRIFTWHHFCSQFRKGCKAIVRYIYVLVVLLVFILIGHGIFMRRIRYFHSQWFEHSALSLSFAQ